MKQIKVYDDDWAKLSNIKIKERKPKIADVVKEMIQKTTKVKS